MCNITVRCGIVIACLKWKFGALQEKCQEILLRADPNGIITQGILRMRFEYK